MADEEQVENGGNKKRQVITAVNFYKLADAIKEERGVLQAECPTLADTARMFEKRLGFQVLPAHIRQAQEVTGVKWIPRIKSTGKGGGRAAHTNSVRVLVTAVRHLHKELAALQKELGKAPCRMPETFDNLHQYIQCRKGNAPGDPEALQAKLSEPEIEQVQNGQQPAAPLPPSGTNIFKVGDEVILDELPFKHYTVRRMSGNGRFATLDNNHEVQVSRLKLIGKGK